MFQVRYRGPDVRQSKDHVRLGRHHQRRIYGGIDRGVARGVRIEIDTRLHPGGPAAVRAGRRRAASPCKYATRGCAELDAHLAWTRAAGGLGVGLDGGRVRRAARHALRDVKDASLRVMVHESHISGELWVMVTLRPRGGVSDRAQALQSVEYQRTLPHVKHLGGFGQAHHARIAHSRLRRCTLHRP